MIVVYGTSSSFTVTLVEETESWNSERRLEFRDVVFRTVR